MKILLYSLIFAPDVCSNAYVFSDMAREMKRQGHDVSVITTTPHYDEATSAQKKEALSFGKKSWYRMSNYNGIPVFHINVAPRKGGIKQRLETFYKFHKYAPKIIKEEQLHADVVIAQTPPMTVGLVCKKMARMMNAKSLLILQDLWLDAMVNRGKIKGLIKGVLEKIERYEYRQIDAVSTISDVMADKVKPKVKDTKKIHVIPNFVDTSIYHPIEVDNDIRAQYGLSEHDFVISYVGNIGNAQDLTPLIECAKAQPDIKVLIAGNGVKEHEFREKAKGVSNVKFLGFVPREETLLINAVSNVCMVMLASHVVATSFPSKTYTIMAMAKPIVITCGEGSAAGTFIEENKIGWAINSDDIEGFNRLISHLSTNREVLKEYGENAFNVIQKGYSEKVVVEQYSDLIKTI